MKIYQQIDCQNFHIGTSAHDDWAPEKGALDVQAPEYDRMTHRAKWDAENLAWDIRTKEEWDAV